VTPQSIAKPAGEPLPALIGTCVHCGERITRLATDSARWRHDDGTVTCTPPAPPADPPFEDVVKGTL
jgi:hypothetical protein